MLAHPNDNLSARFSVSVKGVFTVNGKIPLLFNGRDEWELPGGKLDPGEQPEICIIREIGEELGVATRVDRILDSWLYVIAPDVEVVIVTYACTLIGPPLLRISDEHKKLALFTPAEISGLNMPEGYKRSVHAMFA